MKVNRTATDYINGLETAITINRECIMDLEGMLSMTFSGELNSREQKIVNEIEQLEIEIEAFEDELFRLTKDSNTIRVERKTI